MPLAGRSFFTARRANILLSDRYVDRRAPASTTPCFVCGARVVLWYSGFQAAVDTPEIRDSYYYILHTTTTTTPNVLLSGNPEYGNRPFSLYR